ncbi:hypothetical protein I552_8634 [Mycobacterium xenopi 3993]|nr:hypothetical protein I552_8634 [Mycobacterium xenopi 3993]
MGLGHASVHDLGLDDVVIPPALPERSACQPPGLARRAVAARTLIRTWQPWLR